MISLKLQEFGDGDTRGRQVAEREKGTTNPTPPIGNVYSESSKPILGVLRAPVNTQS